MIYDLQGKIKLLFRFGSDSIPTVDGMLLLALFVCVDDRYSRSLSSERVPGTIPINKKQTGFGSEFQIESRKSKTIDLSTIPILPVFSSRIFLVAFHQVNKIITEIKWDADNIYFGYTVIAVTFSCSAFLIPRYWRRPTTLPSWH